ncbi:hypothetical protein CONPUDRAFT_152735 [Coniophora puteana RWD-64-598 SS2]|uniref:Uncharacterized protein n=1 Tax=Coniophora puteana (strain RWD-64-598) TaxID=741705 RepID=A0A5M3MTH0_CONPW|nr:uncharacterized protein CONPUDRAFT_152735 [Coniophora puteana RWD-64-598 SS2]EIW81831.1 hypothetical protein CONPUDRAFT_152735 [Coniophora puteana RWD-64-598 SS2]
MPVFPSPTCLPGMVIDTNQPHTIQTFVDTLDHRWQQMLMFSRMGGINKVVFDQEWLKEQNELGPIIQAISHPNPYPDIQWRPFVASILLQRGNIFSSDFVTDPTQMNFGHLTKAPPVQNIGVDWWKNVPFSAAQDVAMGSAETDAPSAQPVEPVAPPTSASTSGQSKAAKKPADIVIDDDVPAKPSRQKKATPRDSDADGEGDADGPSAKKKAKPSGMSKAAAEKSKETTKGKETAKSKAAGKTAAGKKGKASQAAAEAEEEEEAEEEVVVEQDDDAAAAAKGKKTAKTKAPKKGTKGANQPVKAGSTAKPAALPVTGQNTWKAPSTDAGGASVGEGTSVPAEVNLGAYAKPFPRGTPVLPHMLVARRSLSPTDLLFADVDVPANVGDMRPYLERQKQFAKEIVKHSFSSHTRYEGRLEAQDLRLEAHMKAVNGRIDDFMKRMEAQVNNLVKVEKSNQALLKKILKQEGKSASGSPSASTASKGLLAENKDENQYRLDTVRLEEGGGKAWTLTPPKRAGSASELPAESPPRQSPSFVQMDEGADNDEDAATERIAPSSPANDEEDGEEE